ncbi:C-factor [Lentinus tigrinus ALCF2SS1-7]|uniref:C-factor n=1 Tax=Lentinus tigrinus ALCF2SS1-6 TaxID=1328759 RepID=A0A5C2S1G2_9APHY|nr:C-factor [Lentinus tigrinus ALCF2SS1-6]RPD71684.1 C-factor [Lentinus tigrinus ALCF2SS1-7]
MAATEETVWFITGTSRGIGLEMTRQLLQTPSNTVVASCRNPSKADALRALAGVAQGKLHIVALDVVDFESIRKCAQEVSAIVGDTGIDYLVNNAGVASGGPDTAYDMDMDVLQRTFLTNVVGPAYITQCFIPLVETSRRKVVLNISSGLGSNAFKIPGVEHMFTSYAISKAAMNMLTTKQARGNKNIVVVCMEPGWLKTELGGPHAKLEVSEGVEGVLKVITSVTPENSGQFIDYKGDHWPW